MKRTGLGAALFGAILVMAGPAAARDKLDEETIRQKEMQRRGDILSRIRGYFAVTG